MKLSTAVKLFTAEDKEGTEVQTVRTSRRSRMGFYLSVLCVLRGGEVAFSIWSQLTAALAQ